MSALPEWWTQSYPQVASVSTATAYLDSLGGNLTREQRDSRWVLSTGDQELFEAPTAEEVDGFILGFALSQLIAARHGPIGRSAPAPEAAGEAVVSPPLDAADAEAGPADPTT